MAKEVKEKKPKKEAEANAKPPEEPVILKGPTPRLKEKYRNEIVPTLLKRNEYKNPMAIPRLEKIVVNMGMGEASRNIKVLDFATDELGRITGQKAVIRRARK